MECISIFDMLKIGVGPSSSHTLGPWRAAERWIIELKEELIFDQIKEVYINLYGSLSLTGKGHATDYAVILGLSGADPEYIPINTIHQIVADVKTTNSIKIGNAHAIPFDYEKHLIFNREFLPFHSNGIKFTCVLENGNKKENTYYSIGGGFVVVEAIVNSQEKSILKQCFPFPINTASELTNYCTLKGKKISEIVLENELSIRSSSAVDIELKRVWSTMLECMYTGCHSEGTLPGGLNVRRRAFDTHKKLMEFQGAPYHDPESWLQAIRKTEVKFRQILKWVSCLALSVNEVNASLGRVVTAPTNGSAGVIPAVLMYYMIIDNHKAAFNHVKQFLLVAGEIGSLFKKGATISAAMGGCQAEIGVSSAMAAGALTELLGGSHEQVLMASEIAMEHHLGLTCDPIGGLVQIPCIERNAMGAIKAINAAEMAIDSDPSHAKVSLDDVINTMWETAKDMNTKYKETSKGGLAIGVNVSDC